MIKLIFCPKKETHYAICVFNILCRRITLLEREKQIKFVKILPHVWMYLDMAGEHLDTIRINNKNPEINVFIYLESYYLTIL